MVSGDGDFSYAVQAVKDMGKHVEVAAFPANLAWELANVADDRIFFKPEYFSDLWSRKRETAKSAPPGGPPRRGWRFGRPRSQEHGVTD